MARKKRKIRLFRRVLDVVKKAVLGCIMLSICLVLLLRFVPVPFTPLMLIRGVEQLVAGEYLHIQHRWVPIGEISKNLSLAIICSEDQLFFEHHGFDVEAIKNSVSARAKKGKRLRGASTISQQTAKNVFLWPHRSWLRKSFEVYFTVLIELGWGKKRILEVYLNSIEMGDGIFGIEAAAHHYFNTSAKKLTRRQAAAIAAILPNPREYKVNPPSRYIRGRIDWIIGQMQRWGKFSEI